MTSSMHFQIYSLYEGWEIQMFDSDDIIKGVWSWGHDDYESGAGGRKIVQRYSNPPWTQCL